MAHRRAAAFRRNDGAWRRLAQCAAEGLTGVSLDEAGMLIGRRFVDLVGGRKVGSAAPSARECQRAIRGAEWIETHALESIDLAGAAAQGRAPAHSIFCGCSAGSLE